MIISIEPAIIFLPWQKVHLSGVGSEIPDIDRSLPLYWSSIPYDVKFKEYARLPLFDPEEKTRNFCVKLIDVAKNKDKPLLVLSTEEILVDLLIEIKTGEAQYHAEGLPLYFTTEKSFTCNQAYYVQYHSGTNEMKFYRQPSFSLKN